MLYLFRENAADLFPHMIPRQPCEVMIDWQSMEELWRRWHPGIRQVPPISGAERIPYQLELFAQDVRTFLEHLTDFPEFAVEPISTSMKLLEADLKVGTWVQDLTVY